jgi:ferric-dicitrate binding protein FerR (iron transport regulator)
MAEVLEDHLADLLVGSIAGRLTEPQRQELSNWGQSDQEVDQLIRDLSDPVVREREMEVWKRIDPQKAYRRWRLRKKKQYATLTAVALLIGAMAWWWLPKSSIQREMVEDALSVGGKNDSAEMQKLPDGTKVWLNSKSTLDYPARFSGDQRVVVLSGEAYFEVARQSKPFVVKTKTNGLRVVVLGTRFDVMAYSDDDSIRATLLDGRVDVQKGNNTVQMEPGEEIAVAKESAELPPPRQVNSSHVVDWKDNYFYFPARASLRTVLKQIARWYDLQVEIHGRIPEQDAYEGKIQRSLPLNYVLQGLLPASVKFHIIGQRLIIEPSNSN